MLGGTLGAKSCPCFYKDLNFLSLCLPSFFLPSLPFFFLPPFLSPSLPLVSFSISWRKLFSGICQGTCFGEYTFRNNRHSLEITPRLLPIHTLKSKPFLNHMHVTGCSFSHPLIPLCVPLGPWGHTPMQSRLSWSGQLKTTALALGTEPWTVACPACTLRTPHALVLALGLKWILQHKSKERRGFLKRSLKKWKPRQCAIWPNTK